MKLASAALVQLQAEISRPSYQRNDSQHGIVHIGVGGFHRAHQAVYTENLLAHGDIGWAICGVGLKDTDKPMQTALRNQDYLYTTIEQHHLQETKVSVIGAITHFIFAPENPEELHRKLAEPAVKIVSLTITEGGYNVDDNTGEFNLNNPDIIHDLANTQRPKTVFGYLTKALDDRRKQGLKPFTIMSCDNLPHNGDVTQKAFLAFAQEYNPQLAAWIRENVTFPNSMVDRITPMTTPAHIAWLSKNYGVEDQWPVVCEPFKQWVLEDNFCNGRPEWEKAGVKFTRDVTPYEDLKIRLLNASHSAMAYLGYLAGYRYTHEVMSDPGLAQFILDFMDQDVTPLLAEVPGLDIETYKRTLIKRFSNSQMGDQLSRLCMHGSTKIPKFLIPTIHQLIEKNRPLDRVALIIASWALYIRNYSLSDVQDPLADKLKPLVSQRDSIATNFLGLKDIFGDQLVNSEAFVHAFELTLDQLESQGVINALKGLSQPHQQRMS